MKTYADLYVPFYRLKETDHIDPDKFVELKTSRIIDNDRQDRNFRWVTITLN